MQNQPHLPDSLHAYLIESTAPENIDDKPNDNTNDNNTYKDKLIPINVDADGGVIDEIVDTLIRSKNPTLVISVHGFNSPRDVILPGFWDSFTRVHNDKYINNRDIVCIGYRWPSEPIFSPRHTIFDASPKFLTILFVVGCISLLLLSTVLIAAWYEHFRGAIGHEATIFIGIADPLVGIFVTLIFLAIPVTLFLLRVTVYFRDGYRASSFGIPDLVEIIRQIDKKLEERQNRSWLSWMGTRPNRVQLSLIGHSMGGYVVTSVIRILSDVFDPASVREGLNSTQLPGGVPDPKALSRVGHAFYLKCLVLVAPDIPAEALISNRANFLSNSLVRFEEVFLFSNEGDEVLRQISTTANYFSFPTKSNVFGYRLGNVCLLGLPYGINVEKFDKSYLKIGKMTLSELYKRIEITSGQLREDLAKRFSYFDCTDCVEDGKGVLTLAKRGHKMGTFDHFFLFLLYIYNPIKHNVHGGYFRSHFLSTLIYRLVCMGYKNTTEAYAAEGYALDKQCQDHQVRVLLKS
ncbi:MAG: hypothetical protein CR217_05515 [Beijerinckiaceae bacterium]|nr:MAG: hypothetical protein CR217_05515 [Beijerinckiaceae bacterium]